MIFAEVKGNIEIQGKGQIIVSGMIGLAIGVGFYV